MTFEQLSHIADIINQNSATYHAVISRFRKDYMDMVGSTLRPTSSLVLTVMVRGKSKSHVKRNQWKVYEQDMERCIQKMKRKDAAIADRYAQNNLTVRDVEVIVRRSSYHALKLKMVPVGLENFQ